MSAVGRAWRDTTPKGWYVVTQHGRVLFDADIRRRLFFPDLDLF
jgi:hypothetical protein